MAQEFEIISHSGANFKVFLVNMLYRTPHVHKAFEICLLLDGHILLLSQKQEMNINKGDFFILNSFQSHELKAQHPALLLTLQVSPSFFSSYYPQIENINFSSSIFPRDINPSLYQTISETILQIAHIYFKKLELHELKCAELLNRTFYHLLQLLPYRTIPDNEKSSSRTRGKRMRIITDYIDKNFSRKLLLSEIAEREQLSLSYLSHFFKNSFGISFQDYLIKIRCEKARQLLLLTELSLLDISIACGFSDPKYFNSGFKRQYNSSPKNHRKQFQHNNLIQQQKSILTTQEFLSPTSSLIHLEHYSLNSQSM